MTAFPGSSGSSGSFARSERLALADLALNVGPNAPTLCDGWTVRDLVVHLLVRERRPLAAPGILVPPLSGLVDRASAKLSRRPFEELVTLLRTPPLLMRLGPVERLVNTVEFFVHHEDARRGQEDWSPRSLPGGEEEQLWRSVSTMGRALVRPAGVPVTVVSGSRRATLRGGPDPVVVSGPVGEVTMFLFGRQAVEGLSFDGPAEKVAALRGAKLGF